MAVLSALLATSPMASAQEQPTDSFLQREREIADKLHAARQAEAPLEGLADLQFGGWIDYYTFHFDDGTQKSRLYQRPGFALWSRLTLDNGAHEIFARTRLSYEHFQPGDEFDLQQDWRGPNFDRAYYGVDVFRALRLANPSDPFSLKVRVGRQETQFGTGYALDLPLDAVWFEVRYEELRLRGLIGKTIASTPNIDRSPAVADHSARRFYGAELSYTGLARHEPFAYALWNQDRTDERTPDFFQEYDYDTQYFGFGSRGSLIKDLNYWTEWVFETGHSYGDGNFLRRDYVDAHGWDVGLEYLFDLPTRPRAALEYMFASGDSNRLGSPTSAVGGNRGTAEDTSFAAFGYRDTGLSASPDLSNVHIWRAGASFVPFEKVELLRDMEFGTNWFLYHKNRARAAISDGTADRRSGWVGWEMDYFVNWRVSSDLSWTLRWGVFFPGDAYRDREARHFILSGLTWSF